MAKLSPSKLLNFSAAVTATSLITSRKLARSFRYYKSRSVQMVYREQLINLCKRIQRDIYSLENLLIEADENKVPFLVSVAGQIFDQTDELHRKLLFYDADSISEIIPLVDHQRSYWKGHTDVSFYNENLLMHLEHEIIPALKEIEQQVNRLEDSTSL